MDVVGDDRRHEDSSLRSSPQVIKTNAKKKCFGTREVTRTHEQPLYAHPLALAAVERDERTVLPGKRNAVGTGLSQVGTA